jgi:hypothetical protein
MSLTVSFLPKLGKLIAIHIPAKSVGNSATAISMVNTAPFPRSLAHPRLSDAIFSLPIIPPSEEITHYLSELPGSVN